MRPAPPLAFALASLLVVTGCVTSNYYETRDESRYPNTVLVPDAPYPPRGLPMFAGATGRILIWTDLMQGVLWADVVFLGETHDDAVAHRVQRTVVGDTLMIDPRLALSMEMLDRGEQPLVDEYLAGAIDQAAFVAAVKWKSTNDPGSWSAWYQPVIDEAKRSGAPVVAANAPRQYVRMARTEGWAALEALPPEEQALFDLPRQVADDGPERRFAEFMRSSWAEHAPAPPGPESPADAASGPSAEEIAAAWRSQSLWDSTMAASISSALGPPWNRTRVIHLVGEFHTDSNGGLVQQLRAREPFVKVLTVSMRPRRERELQEEDRGVADVVIYTGWTGRDD